MKRLLRLVLAAVMATNIPLTVGAAERATNRHEINLRHDGSLSGQVRVHDVEGDLTPARVRIKFLQQGRVAAETVTDEFGSFRVTNLQPGIYSILAIGPAGMGGASFKVLEHADAEEVLPKGVDEVANVEEPAQPVLGGPGVVSDSTDQSSPSWLVDITLERTPSMQTTLRLLRQLMPDLKVGDPPTARGELWGLPVSGQKYPSDVVEIDAKGYLRGRLLRYNEEGELVPARSPIFFMREAEIVGQATPNNNGEFEVLGLTTGVYGVAVVGNDGFAVFGARLERSGSGSPGVRVVRNAGSPFTPVAARTTTRATTIAVTLMQPGSEEEVMNTANTENSEGTQGGGTAGGGPGGGTGGGSNLLGELLAAAAAAAGLAAALSNH